MPQDRPTMVALFAGGGGMDLGFRQAGFEALWATDIEGSAARTFALNHPDTKFVQGDARHFTPTEVQALCGGHDVDVVVGGPPCQGFSTLGDQLNGDPRNSMFETYARIVSWISPKTFLMENTAYLRSQYSGAYEREIETALSALGYRVTVATLDAADFGVPQHRRRVFFFGTRLDSPFDWPRPNHGPEGVQPYATVGDAIMDLAGLGPEEALNHDPLRHGDVVIRRYQLIPEGGRLPAPSELPEDIRRRNFGNTYKRLHRERPSLTLVPGNNAFPVHPTLDRSLTPREAARLQGFPDDYAFAGSRAEQCKLIGNAVPVRLAGTIADTILEHVQGSDGKAMLPLTVEQARPVSPMHQTSGRRSVKQEKPLTAVSFFTGAGGLALGFMRSGFDVVLSVDKKNIVDKNMALNFPDVPHEHLDVAEMTAEELKALVGRKSVDVVFGGSPCQGFSMFGNRRFVNTKGHVLEDDPRNELTLKYLELAISLNPKAILLENVKGLLRAPRGDSSYIEESVRILEEAGYRVEYELMNTASFGVPQARERVILVAVKKRLKFKWPEAKFFGEPESWQRPFVTVWDAIADLADPQTHADDFSHVPMQHKELLVRRYELIPEGGRLPEADLPEDLQKGYRTERVKNFSHVYKRLDRSKPATTMVPGHNAFPIHPTLPRSLTVREAARIQTFPDWFKFVGTRQQQCILVGNAVPPRLAEILAQSLAKSIRGNYEAPGYKADHYELKAAR